MRAIFFAAAFICGGLAMQHAGVEAYAAYAFWGYIVGILHATTIFASDGGR